MLQIELGHGDKLVTDIYDSGGDWAGIAISDTSKAPCPVGENRDTGADTAGDLDLIATIVTSNPESLDVIIRACERAKARLVKHPEGEDYD